MGRLNVGARPAAWALGAALLMVVALGPRPVAASGTVTLSGTVVSSASSSGIGGASVSTQPATQTATTSSNGDYTLTVSPNTTYNVIASAPGYNTNFASVAVGSSNTVTPTLTLYAVPPQASEDLFSRPNQGGIGTPSDGTDSWSTDNASANAIASRQLSLQPAGGSVDDWMGTATQYQDEVVSADADITTASGTARLLARVQPLGNTWVELVLDPAHDFLTLATVSGGSSRTLRSWAAAPNLGFSVTYHLKLEVVGNTVAAKEWTGSNPEPAWEVSATQNAISSGGVGGLGAAGGTVTMANYLELPVTQISGTVSDAGTGQQIAGATVSAGTVTTTTGTNGSYTLGGLTSGTYTVMASAPNYSPSSASATVSTGVSASANLQLTYSPPPPPSGGTTISGTVTDAGTGAPVGGALVETQPTTGSVTTDSSGSYSLSVPAGSYSVRVSAPGYNSNYAAADTTGSNATADILLTEVPPKAAEDLFSRPNQSGIGTASDGHVWTDDSAIYNLGSEQILGNQLYVQTAAAQTDYDAWMGIPYQDEQITADFECRSGSGAGYGCRLLARVQGEETWLEFLVGQNILQLWAASSDIWTPLKTASVPTALDQWYHAKVDVIGTLVEGKIWPVGSAEPAAWQIQANQSVVSGQGYGGLRVTGGNAYYTNFQESPITVTGTVSNAGNSQPIAGATVTVAGGPSTTTDANGNYMLSGISTNRYAITASAPGYGSSSQSVSVTTGMDTPVNFSLASTATPPSAALAVSPSSGSAPLSVTADASQSTAGSAAIASYTFNFGDGSPSTTVSAPTATATHIYQGGGTFMVTVTVTDSDGGTATATASVMVTSPYLVQDTFSRANQTGWGTASDGMVWSSGSGLSISSGKGIISYSGASQFETLGSAASADENGLVRFSIGAANDTAGIMLRSHNGDWAMGRFDGQGDVQYLVHVGGTSTSVAKVKVSVALGSLYWLRFELQGANAYLKLWPDGSSEPSAWTWAGTSNLLTGAGGMGLYGWAATGGPVTFDSFSVAPVVTVTPPTATLKVTPSAGAAPLTVSADASQSSPGSAPITGYTFTFGDGSAPVTQGAPTDSHVYSSGGSFPVTVTVTDADGGSATAQSTVLVGQPVAQLQVSPSRGAVPLTVTADASGSSDPIAISSYTFDFGDGTSAGPQASPSATHTFSSPGSYTVTVTVTDTAGASGIATQGVVASTPPTASLSLNQSSGAAPLQVVADASASTPGSTAITSYTFTFGDGSAPVVQGAGSPAATHTYTAGGVFTVTVTVTDVDGTTATAQSTVTVGDPVASLRVSPSSGPGPLNVTADASGSTDPIGISSYTFAWGDGSPSTTVSSPSDTAGHTFSSSGSYTVTVTVSDGVGATSSASQTVVVATPPTPKLTVSPGSGAPPLPVTADGSKSTGGSTAISTYMFDWGDGTTPTTVTAPTDTASHTYQTGGTFTITLTVTDQDGSTATATQTVTVATPPTASLTVSPASGAVPLPVTANASASTAGSTPVSSYAFDFGDGYTVAPQSSSTATHTYSAAGAYTVTVTVTDQDQSSSTASQTVVVSIPPTAAVTVSPSTGAAPLPVTADGSKSTAGSTAISVYTFDWGDGTAPTTVTAPADTASHTYQTGGTFTVTLTVTDQDGSTATATQTVTVTAPSVQDTFVRANQTGWGTASNGMTWSAGSGLSIANDEGVISTSSASQFLTLGSATAADGNGLVRFSVASTTNTAGIILRVQSNGNMDLARYDGAGNLEFMVRVGGTWTIVAKTPVSVAAGSFYWLRFQLQGSNVYLKLWASGTSEPGAWTWSGVSTTITSAGQMGLYGWAGASAGVKFDSFSVS